MTCIEAPCIKITILPDKLPKKGMKPHVVLVGRLKVGFTKVVR